MHCHSKVPRICLLISIEINLPFLQFSLKKRIGNLSWVCVQKFLFVGIGSRFPPDSNKPGPGGISSLILKLSPGNVFFQTLTLSHTWKWAEQDYWSHYLIISLSHLFSDFDIAHITGDAEREDACVQGRGPQGARAPRRLLQVCLLLYLNSYRVSVC